MWFVSNTSLSLSLLTPTSCRDLFLGALPLFSLSFFFFLINTYINIDTVFFRGLAGTGGYIERK